jgi:hypothetical protein
VIEGMWRLDLVADQHPDIGDKDVQGFENLSIVTECGTGDLYVLGVNGGEFPDTANEWWLHRLEDGPTLKFVDKNTLDIRGDACNPRASGTAFAGAYGELGLYCHQKGQRDNQTINAVTCAIAVHNVVTSGDWAAFLDMFAPGLAGVVVIGSAAAAAGTCPQAILPDNEVAFTELWPTDPTPETPPPETVGVRARTAAEVLPNGRRPLYVGSASRSAVHGTEVMPVVPAKQRCVGLLGCWAVADTRTGHGRLLGHAYCTTSVRGRTTSTTP